MRKRLLRKFTDSKSDYSKSKNCVIRGGQAVSAAAGEDSGHAQGAEEQNEISFFFGV
jgi:hypothetical protein